MHSKTQRKLLAALLSTGFAVVAVEIGLRISGYSPMEAALGGKGQVLRASSDARLRYELAPSTEGPGWGTYVMINSHGFRDTEYPLEKNGSLRVCVLGDSITFGNHLTPEETYSELLEEGLKERGTTQPVDVLNLGVGGYDTVQEVAMLEHTGLQFDPDLVVLGFCVNDLGIVSVTMEHSWSESDRENPIYASRIAQAVRGFFDERERRRETVGWNSDEIYAKAFADQVTSLDDDQDLKQLMLRLRADLQAKRQDESLLESTLARRIPPRWFSSPARVGRFVFALDRLAELSRERGFKAALLIVPYLDSEPTFAQAYEIVRYLALNRGIVVLEVQEDFERVGLDELRIDPEDPVHPDARGHRILAERLIEYLAGLGWVLPQ